MNGKAIAVIIAATALIAGGLMYYLQVYAFYDRLPPASVVMLAPRDGAPPQPVDVAGFQGIDASSSPLRYRACFTLPEAAGLAERYRPYPNAEPLTAPGWFDCFDAAEIGAALESGRAQAFLSQPEIADGVDRVIAVYPDGRAFAWHQLNEKYRD
jgi:hypothetical protein